MNPRLQQLYDKLEKQKESLLGSLRHLSNERLNHQPLGKWSISQIVAHLISAEKLSIQYLNKKIFAVNEVADTGFVEELKMILLIVSQRLPFKFKAPKVVVDHTSKETHFNKLVEEWNKTRIDLKNILDRIEDRHVKRKIYRHVRTGMMNIQHALKFFHEHVSHHIPQINRLV